MAQERVTVEDAEAGERLDRVLAARLAAYSRTRLKHLVESGQVMLEGATITDPSLRVKPGQSFTVAIPPPVDDRPTPQAMALAIVYEDEQVLVLDKPAGLVVHPAPGNLDRTLVNAPSRIAATASPASAASSARGSFTVSTRIRAACW